MELTDERIKKEYDVWIGDGECTENERRFFAQYPVENHLTAVGFYAGFRTAERLAKIEVLEEVRKNSPHGYVLAYIEKRIAELKEAILSSPVKEGKTDDEKLAIAVKALEKISGRGMTGGGIAKRALKEIQ